SEVSPKRPAWGVGAVRAVAVPRRAVEYEQRTRPAAGVARRGIGWRPRSALRAGNEPRGAILNPEVVNHEDEADQRIAIGAGGLMRRIGRDVGQEGGRGGGAELRPSAQPLRSGAR